MREVEPFIQKAPARMLFPGAEEIAEGSVKLIGVARSMRLIRSTGREKMSSALLRIDRKFRLFLAGSGDIGFAESMRL